MKTSTALKRTKAKLWDGKTKERTLNKSTYICFAAGKCADGTVFCIVSPIISHLLEGHRFLEEWLMAHHGIDARSDREKMQATRHAWLDHLIDHYESIGD